MCESGCVTLTVQSLVILFVFVLSALFLLIGLTALLLATLILLLPRMAALLAGLSALLAIAIHFVCHEKVLLRYASRAPGDFKETCCYLVAVRGRKVGINGLLEIPE